jgi:hypothetical protein
MKKSVSNSAHVVVPCAPAPAVCRGAAEHCRQIDPKPHDLDWLTPQQFGHSPMSDFPWPSERSVPRFLCRLAACPGLDDRTIHRICTRRAFGTTSRWSLRARVRRRFDQLRNAPERHRPEERQFGWPGRTADEQGHVDLPVHFRRTELEIGGLQSEDRPMQSDGGGRVHSRGDSAGASGHSGAAKAAARSGWA